MNLQFKKVSIIGMLISCSLIAHAQIISVSLDTSYLLAEKNYPLVKQYELIAKSKEYSLENIGKGFLPQININGSASYQSEVIGLSKAIPGVTALDKDQYKIFADINQPIYDGGMVKEQKKLQEANSIADKQKLEVEMYKLKERINQLFFGVLLISEQLKQNALMKSDIELGLNKVEAQIANGSALRSNADMLKAELLKAIQQTIELKSNRKAFTDMLGFFINRTIDTNTVFIKPPNIASSPEINRPELLMYDFQNKIFDAQNNLLTAQNRPKVSLFAQSGFGRPGLNYLSNNFEDYYIGGLRLNFPITGFYSVKNDRKLIDIQKQGIAVQKETFLFNTHLAVKQQNSEILKQEEFLKTDDEIILLRTNVKKASLSQLENGVINSSDYIRELNAEDNARQTKILHEIQLLIAEYNERNTVGG